MAGEEAELHPAEEVIHDGFGVADLFVAGPAGGLEAGVGELFGEDLEGDAVLQGERDGGGEGVHEAGDGGALLGHADKDFAGAVVGVEADGDVALMAGDVEFVGDGGALRGEAVADGAGWALLVAMVDVRGGAGVQGVELGLDGGEAGGDAVAGVGEDCDVVLGGLGLRASLGEGLLGERLVGGVGLGELDVAGRDGGVVGVGGGGAGGLGDGGLDAPGVGVFVGFLVLVGGDVEGLGALGAVTVDGDGLEAEAPGLGVGVGDLLHGAVVGKVDGFGDGAGEEGLGGGHHFDVAEPGDGAGALGGLEAAVEDGEVFGLEAGGALNGAGGVDVADDVVDLGVGVAEFEEGAGDGVVDDLDHAAADELFVLDEGEVGLDAGGVAVHHEADGAGGGEDGGLGVAVAVLLAEGEGGVPGVLGGLP